MTVLTIPISDESAEHLREVSSRLGVSPEDLARAGIDDLLRRSDNKVRAAMEYVLSKNEELYRRLA